MSLKVKIHNVMLCLALMESFNSPSIYAQQAHAEYAAVKLIVDQFFESINTGNGELIANLELEGAQVLNIREDVAGEYTFVERPWFGADSFNAASSNANNNTPNNTTANNTTANNTDAINTTANNTDANNTNAVTQLSERYWDEQLLISDHLAVFWAPYDFHIDGEFSHCGIDVLNLIKVDGVWKISHAMWTIQRPNCEPSPLGPLP